MLYRKENLNIESKVVGEITHNIISFIRGRSVVEPQLCFVLVYAAHIALTNNVNDADDLLSFIEENVSEQRAMFVSWKIVCRIWYSGIAFKTCKQDFRYQRKRKSS